MKYVIANLKMNVMTGQESDVYLETLKKLIGDKKLANTTVILCPSTLFLERFISKLPESVQLGSQNVFWEDKGSFTGEISPVMLRNTGIKYVICGHSERRQYQGESNDVIAQKVTAVLRNGMKPILCIGETQEERDRDETIMVLTEQLHEALAQVSIEQIHNVLIAYEPRWSIGTGLVPSTQDIMQVRIMIQKILIKQYDHEAMQKVAIVYGGSVNAENTNAVSLDADMNGVLVGKEGLQAQSLMSIIGVLEADAQ